MATYTPNLSLYMPDSTDDFGEFREEHNDNMVKIDNAIGGGGGSGGHTIVNENGTDMPAEGKLQFTGNVSVTDDSVNGKTVVDILGGGGNVYGAFIDPSQIITNGSYTGTLTYTAIRDCIVVLDIAGDANTATAIQINGVTVNGLYHTTNGTNDITFSVPLKMGQILTVTNGNAWLCTYSVYGLTQGTNGIFTPIIYSDTERVVGVWRDNKPLYQKTISVAPLPNSGTKEIQLDNDIEKIISMNGYAIDGNDKWDIFFNDVVPTNNNASIRVYTNTITKKLYITTAVDLSSYTEAYITLQYTKTTDVAGSGNWNTDGVPTVHYSTSEQVIGTWIDGKPLYQKTVNFGSIPSNATKEVDHNITDLKITVDFEGTMISGSVCETLPSGENSNFRIQTTPTKLKVITGASWSGWNESYITLKYTKVTD